MTKGNQNRESGTHFIYIKFQLQIKFLNAITSCTQHKQHIVTLLDKPNWYGNIRKNNLNQYYFPDKKN